jgi:hypothetical protein
MPLQIRVVTQSCPASQGAIVKGNLSTQSRYPAQRSFVVQVAQPTPGEEDVPLGRVEHLVSGRSTHFASWAEFEAFIDQVLTKTENQPP